MLKILAVIALAMGFLFGCGGYKTKCTQHYHCWTSNETCSKETWRCVPGCKNSKDCGSGNCVLEWDTKAYPSALGRCTP